MLGDVRCKDQTQSLPSEAYNLGKIWRQKPASPRVGAENYFEPKSLHQYQPDRGWLLTTEEGPGNSHPGSTKVNEKIPLIDPSENGRI